MDELEKLCSNLRFIVENRVSNLHNNIKLVTFSME